MAIQELDIKITGTQPLLMANPQTVDTFNIYAKEMKKITDKKTRKTDEDRLRYRDLEVRSKIYWDDDLGIYVPGTWVSSAIAGCSFKKAKISKADIRASVFVSDSKIKLSYSDENKVKSPQDIVHNEWFRLIMNLRQGQVRVAKAVPIFHNWSFKTSVEFDDSFIDPETLKELLLHASKYGGFGDFRPTFGRAAAEVS